LRLRISLVVAGGAVLVAGPERMPADALRRRPSRADAEQLADALQTYAREPDGPQRDDIAIVALRFVDRRRDRASGYAGDSPREVTLCAPPLLSPLV